MSYTDPCKGDCGANHWPDCSTECSSRKPIKYTKEQESKFQLENIRKQKGKKICDKEGHDWEYSFIVYNCKRCGEISDY